jgi:hypothetical protein
MSSAEGENVIQRFPIPLGIRDNKMILYLNYDYGGETGAGVGLDPAGCGLATKRNITQFL